MAQLLFDLGQRAAQGREDFLVAPCNEVAVAWIDRWPEWPGAAFALFGPPGCGKTHLLQVWRAMSGAVEIDPAALPGALGEMRLPELLGPAKAVALDGCDAFACGDARSERALLHLHNLVVESGGHLLFTARQAPARWPLALPDLKSRLAAVQAIALEAPDDALIEALLFKLFADRQLAASAEVVGYLVSRMERSHGAARRLVAAIDRAALLSRREITVPLARQVLHDLEAPPNQQTESDTKSR